MGGQYIIIIIYLTHGFSHYFYSYHCGTVPGIAHAGGQELSQHDDDELLVPCAAAIQAKTRTAIAAAKISRTGRLHFIFECQKKKKTKIFLDSFEPSSWR